MDVESKKQTRHILAASLQTTKITSTGRWPRTTHHGGLIASWAGAALRIRVRARALAITFGPATGRMDAGDNGGLKSILATVRVPGAPAREILADARAGEQLVLLDCAELVEANVEVCTIDWATRVEIATFDVTDGEILPLLNPNAPAWRLLFIGDSITTGTGYVDETYTSVLARGSADAYPFALADELRAADIDVGVEVVAYPGCTLVDRAPEVEGGGLGMISKFWSATPWDVKDTWTFVANHRPDIAIVALGVNDDYRQVPAEHFLTDMGLFLESLADRLPRSLEHILVLSPWPYDNAPLPNGIYEPALRDAVAARAAKWKAIRSLRKKRPVLHHVDTQGWYGDGDHLDGIHPSAAGHVKIARRLREWLEAEGLLPAHGNDAGG